MQKDKSIGWLIVFIAISLLTMLSIQYVLIRNSIERTNEDFDRRVNEVLPDLVKRMETNNYCVAFFNKIKLPSDRRFGFIVLGDSIHKEESLPIYFYNKNFADSLMRFDSINFEIPVEMHLNLDVEFLVDEVDAPQGNIDDINHFKEGFEDEVLKLNLLDSLLKNRFKEENISQDFDYLLRETDTREILYTSNAVSNTDMIVSGIRVPIFEKNRYYRTYDLFLYFPNKYREAFRANLLLILSSTIMLFVFVVLFIVFFRMLFKERKLSEMKIDFVNNITHEFKTPISNIKLALHALRKTIPETEEEMMNIIEEENERLHDGMDRILTTSLLGREELLLHKKILEADYLLEGLLTRNRLAIEKRGGTIVWDTDGEQAVICVDPLHLKNVINNLIDNALKYSEGLPYIKMSSRVVRNNLIIEIADKGKGISGKDLPYIFDRFYRVSTQNRHETYGYGIGLSYVKMMVNAHQGRIDVTSKLGVGSTFIISLPLYE